MTEQISGGKPLNPWVAALLSLFVPGLGHLYCGWPLFGFLVYVGLLLPVLVAGQVGILSTFPGFVALMAWGIVLFPIAILHSCLIAVKTKNYERKAYNRWYVYVILCLVAGLIGNVVLINREAVLGYAAYRIPSVAMQPSLLIGDYILVDTPVIKAFRGDVIVFRYPEDERISYIKRVIGLPGDNITYRNKIVYINGEPMAQESDGAWIGEGQNRNPPGRRPVIKTEQLGDVDHQIVVYPDQPQRIARNWVVPEGHYFVLGDNRDLALDSRAWGFVPEENLVGRATRIWMHWDCSRGCVDFGRIGDKIN